MPIRTRTADHRLSYEGTLTFHGTPQVIRKKSGLQGHYLESTDTTGNREGVNPLELSQRYFDRPSLSGSRFNSSGVKTVTFNNYPTGYQPNPVDPNTLYPPPSTADKINAYWEIVAQTNPNTPHVSVPQMLGELKDIPGLVQGWGRNRLQDIARGHLSWRWVYKPMLSDLQKLYRFADAVNQRLRWLRKLKKGKTLRKRTLLKRDNTSLDHGVVIFHSESASVQCSRVSHCSIEQWGSCQWILVDPGDIPDDFEGQNQLARELARGTTGYALLTTAWELTPWSWFSDWFTNIGNFLAAGNNTVSVKPSKVCLMRTVVNKTSFPLVFDLQDTVRLSHTAVCKWTRKSRYVLAEPLSPFLPTKVPFLDGGKWSILASLTALGSHGPYTGIRGIPRARGM